MTIVLKGTKGSALTHNEVDGNFSDLDGRVTTLEGAGSGVALTDLSVTTATAGTAALAYDNATGVFTYTPPDVSDYATVSGNLASLESSIASTYLTIAGTNGMIDGHLNVSGATSGQILSWDGSDYAWVADQTGGGGGSQSRSTATGTTGSIADAAEEDLDITGFKSYALLTITTDVAARVRLYTTGAARTADAARAEGTDPTSDAGLIAEVITTGAETVTISPGAIGFNLEGTPTTTIPCRVTNKSGSTGTVQVDLNILQLEA
jgi:hypothetical protein